MTGAATSGNGGDPMFAWRLVVIIGTLLILAFALFACRTSIPIARTDTIRETTTEYVLRDTIITVRDSSSLQAVLECDSIGRVKLRQVEEYYRGAFLRQSLAIRGNTLHVMGRIDSLTVKARNKETRTTQNVSKTAVYVRYVNYLTRWQIFQVICGKILLALVVLVVGWQVVKLGVRLGWFG